MTHRRTLLWLLFPTVVAALAVHLGISQAAAPSRRGGAPAATRPAPAPTTQPVAASRPAPPVTAYVDPTTGFSILPPKFSDTPQRTPAVAFYAAPQNGSSATVNVHVDPVRSNRRDYVEISMRELRRREAKMNENRQLTVEGHDAQLLDYESTIGARRLRFLQLLVITDDIVYIVTCTAPVETFTQYRDAFQKCVDSFRPPAK